jgi:hypothetical protein
MKTYEAILKKGKLVNELITLAYESDDSSLEIDSLLNSALKYVPVKELNKWKKQYLKTKEGK